MIINLYWGEGAFGTGPTQNCLFHGLFYTIISNNTHVINEKTESWRGYDIYQRSQSEPVASLDMVPDLFDMRTYHFTL